MPTVLRTWPRVLTESLAPRGPTLDSSAALRNVQPHTRQDFHTPSEPPAHRAPSSTCDRSTSCRRDDSAVPKTGDGRRARRLFHLRRPHRPRHGRGQNRRGQQPRRDRCTRGRFRCPRHSRSRTRSGQDMRPCRTGDSCPTWSEEAEAEALPLLRLEWPVHVQLRPRTRAPEAALRCLRPRHRRDETLGVDPSLGAVEVRRGRPVENKTDIDVDPVAFDVAKQPTVTIHVVEPWVCFEEHRAADGRQP